ncbi:MFS transporter [Fimbriiglobus ruber]|uniref:Oxalate/formate antiporter n=1 Tax=Fimbriiglobus ruber TaxID=1908690 RepID=A0A225DNS2_9BACT|nr:MFS transporter [Fimbriiglobus ruber]OWK38005.1 Oxalate/formate antiporter [Fimbriiglobus ruber]
MGADQKVPARAWVVTGAGTAVNLCLGILYAWSVWKANLLASPAHPAGEPMEGANAGWTYLSSTQATWAYAICGFTFALFMIPGGRIQDRFGPRAGVTLGGLCLAAGCVVAGLMQNFTGLLLGFGLLGGIGMGLGYAAATPAAVKWFGPHRRGLIVGLVVGGYGGAAIYISPLATYLIKNYGLTESFVVLGCLFALVVVAAGSLLKRPPEGYVPPGAPAATGPNPTQSQTDWVPREVLRTWQYYALVVLFIGSAQSGLLVIANATKTLNDTARHIPFFAQNAWLLASFGGLVNALGRIGTGSYSDRVGRRNAYALNGLVSAVCLFLTPTVIADQNVALLFVVVGVAFWQYGGGLSLMPALTADFFGAKNLGTNYGLVFLGWGIAFFVPQAAEYISEATQNRDVPFYLSGALLIATVILSRFVTRPVRAGEKS